MLLLNSRTVPNVDSHSFRIHREYLQAMARRVRIKDKLLSVSEKAWFRAIFGML